MTSPFPAEPVPHGLMPIVLQMSTSLKCRLAQRGLYGGPEAGVITWRRIFNFRCWWFWPLMSLRLDSLENQLFGATPERLGSDALVTWHEHCPRCREGWNERIDGRRSTGVLRSSELAP